MDYKTDINNAKAAGFGGIFHPKLPPMGFVLLEKEYGYQAVCINTLLDATGKRPEDACENLAKTHESFLKQMIHNHNGDKKAAFKYIAQVAFEDGEIKTLYYNRYKQVRHDYVNAMIAKKKKPIPKKEALTIFLNAIFPFPSHVKFNLTVAAT